MCRKRSGEVRSTEVLLGGLPRLGVLLTLHGVDTSDHRGLEDVGRFEVQPTSVHDAEDPVRAREIRSTDDHEERAVAGECRQRVPLALRPGRETLVQGFGVLPDGDLAVGLQWLVRQFGELTDLPRVLNSLLEEGRVLLAEA
jgi:hypothetical protein